MKKKRTKGQSERAGVRGLRGRAMGQWGVAPSEEK